MNFKKSIKNIKMLKKRQLSKLSGGKRGALDNAISEIKKEKKKLEKKIGILDKAITQLEDVGIELKSSNNNGNNHNRNNNNNSNTT